MTFTYSRSLTLAALIGLSVACPLSAETIMKLELGETSPDVIYRDGELRTQDDGLYTDSDGDRQTDVTFLGFVSEAEIENIPSGASITLSGIKASGKALVFNDTIVNQATEGGSFELYDDSNKLLLKGDLMGGILSGPLSAGGASTGSLFTVNLGTFTGPEGDNDQLFSLLAPNSAQLSMSFTNVNDGNGGSGLTIDADEVLQDFEADVTAQIAAEASANLVPEPASIGLVMMGAFAFLGLRRRR